MIPLNNNSSIFEEKKLHINNNYINNIPEPNFTHKSYSQSEGIIEFIFIKFSNSVRLIGPLFAFCLVVFVISVANSVFNFIIPYWIKNIHFIFGIVLFPLSLYILFSILFNYFLAVLVKPGSMEDIKNSKYYRKNDPLNISNNIIKFENSKLAANLTNFYMEEKKKNELCSTSHIKIRYKTNDYEINNNEDYNRQIDIKTLDELENKLNKEIKENRKLNDIKFNFESDSIDEVDNQDLENYNKITGNAIGCVYPSDQIKESMNKDEPKHYLFDRFDNVNYEGNKINLNSENLEDEEFINKMDIQLEKLEKSKNNSTLYTSSTSSNSSSNPTNNSNKENYFQINNSTITNNSISLSENSNISFNPNESPFKDLSECKYCKEIKPLRAHHCTICNICILKMDHHCPWINNCVGQNNQRYFILFLTHTFFGCLYVILIGIPIIFNSSIKKSQDSTFIFVLCFAGSVLLIFFNAWNWFLVVKGYTTIEFWTNQTHASMKSKINLNEYFFTNWKENLLVVFGTKSIFKAIFIPSIKKLPISGLEFTKMVYPSFKMDFCDLNEENDLNIILENEDGNNAFMKDQISFCKKEPKKDSYNNGSKYLDLV